MWSNQPQFNSVGRLRFLSYVNSDGATVRSEYTGSNIISSGTSYADIEYSYRSDCNSMEYTLRHVEFPQNDENRTYYTMDLVFHRDIDIADVRNNFTLFDFDGRFQAFKTTSYKSANGSIVDVTNNISKVSAPQLYTLSKDSPFFSYYNYDPDSSANKNDVMNFAMLIRDYSVTIEGKAWEGNLILRNSLFLNGSNMLNLAALSLDLGDTSFKSGDRITMSFILLPYGVKNMTDDPNVHYVYEDSIENPWRIKSAEIGTIVEDEYLAEINCTDNTAQFTVTGGRNACVVRVNGFTKLVRPKLQELVNNEWVDITYSVEEYDGYQVNYTFDGNYSYSFVINMEKPSDERTFRVTSE